MSHFCVAVIVDEPTEAAVAEVLAPYDEEIEVEPYIYRTKAELISNAKELKKRLTKRIESSVNYELSKYEKQLLGCETDEDFYAYMYDEYEKYDEDGNELSTYNPKSKWDWWTLRGRFGTNGEFIQLKDVVLEREDADPKKYEREWEIFVEGAEMTKEEEENIWNIWNSQYYIDRYGDKETYIRIRSLDLPYALVDKADWYEQGSMGWWGMDNANKDSIINFAEFYQEYIRNVNNQNKYLVFADLHI